MEIIMSYIDSMFAGVPVTDDTKRLREDITANMCDKYDELIKEGKSTNEAIGTVISEFGNIDEVLTEMGVSRVQAVPAAIQTADPARPHVKRIRLFGSLAGIGAGLIVCGASFVSALAAANYWGRTFSEFGAAGVVLLLGGMTMIIFAMLVRTRILTECAALTPEIRNLLKLQYAENEKHDFKLRMIFGGLQFGAFVICILADIPSGNSCNAHIFMTLVVAAAFANEMYIRLVHRTYGIVFGEPKTPLTLRYFIELLTVPFLTLGQTFARYCYDSFGSMSGFDVAGFVVIAYMTAFTVAGMFDRAKKRTEQILTNTAVKTEEQTVR